MILVAVGDEQRAQLVAPVAQVAEIVDDDVYAVHLFVGKHQAAVDGDDVVLRLEQRHVAADFAATAERDDANVRLVRRRRDDQRVCVGLAVQNRGGSLLEGGCA